MRELTADMFVSLDGFAAGANGGQSWTFGYFGPQFADYAQRVLAEPQILIMGRVTYEIMARSWPSSPGPLAGPMNSLPQLVFSATLAEPLAWSNAQLAKNGPVEEVSALKGQPGDPLRTIGSITLVRHLMAAGLVDPAPPGGVPARARAGRPRASLRRLPGDQPRAGQHHRPGLPPGGL